MIDVLKELFKQPYWTLALIFDVILISFPFVTKTNNGWEARSPQTWALVYVGFGLLLLSAAAFWFSLRAKRAGKEEEMGRGVDLTRVKERDGVLWTVVSGCQMGKWTTSVH